MNILAVGAHPDDIEFQCAGALAKCRARGDGVAMAVATNGEVGSSSLGKAEIAAVRRREAEDSARVLGAEFHWMGFPDEFLFETEATRLAFIDLIRRAKPDVIITHAPEDYHADHVATSRLVADARMMVTVPNVETGAPPLARIPEIYYMDTVTGIRFQPDEYVDITETMELKREMLAKHASQSRWLEDQYGMSYMDFVEITARFRGLQAGVRYAEGFRRLEIWPRGVRGRRLP